MIGDTPKREAELQEIEYLISDIIHNMSLPSTQSWTLGEWRDYAVTLLMPKIHASLATPAVPDELRKAVGRISATVKIGDLTICEKDWHSTREKARKWDAVTTIVEDGESFQDALSRLSARSSVPDGEKHPDDVAVDRLSVAMKVKLAQKRDEGRGGWEDKQACHELALQDMLLQNVVKGDPVDVANFCMMLFNRGERTGVPGYETAPKQDESVE